MERQRKSQLQLYLDERTSFLQLAQEEMEQDRMAVGATTDTVNSKTDPIAPYLFPRIDRIRSFGSLLSNLKKGTYTEWSTYLRTSTAIQTPRPPEERR